MTERLIDSNVSLDLHEDACRWGMEYVYSPKYFTDSFLLNSDTVELIRLCLKIEKKDLKN